MDGNIIYHDGTILKGYCNDFKKLYADQLYYLTMVAEAATEADAQVVFRCRECSLSSLDRKSVV